MPRLRILGGPGFYPGNIQLCKPPLPEIGNLSDKLATTLKSGILTKGIQLSTFEAEMAEYMGSNYAVGVSSCTIGLALALASLKMTMNARLEERIKVAIPSFTFLATATSSMWAGCDPVFVDADLRTYNMDINDLEEKLEKHGDISAIVFTHVFGSPTGIDQVLGISKKHGMPVLFDSAHGFGILHDGTPIGKHGKASSFSMTPTKLLTSGEGGFVITNDDDMAKNLRILREYGSKPGIHDTVYPGLNGRMSELHAILGRWGLDQIESEAQARNDRVEIYKECLSSVKGLTYQVIAENDRSSYKDFGIRIDGNSFGLTRDQLVTVLKTEGIESKTYFYPTVHKHEYFNKTPNTEDDCPNATQLSEEMICPPLFGSMTDVQQNAIINTIVSAHKNASQIREEIG